MAEDDDQPPATGAFDDFVAVKVHMLSTLLRRSQMLRYQRLVKLSLVESRMINRIGSSDRASLKAIADQLGIGKSQSSRVMNSLVRRGLVVSNRSEASLREVELSLTPPGREIFELLYKAGQERNAQLIDGIPPRDVATVHRVLAEIIEHARDLLASDQQAAGVDGAEFEED